MYVCSVADLLFVQGTEVIFKVALCLLSNHEGEILECDSFESIVDYLKSTIPTLTHSQMEETITKVHLKWNKLYSCIYGDLISSTNMNFFFFFLHLCFVSQGVDTWSCWYMCSWYFFSFFYINIFI